MGQDLTGKVALVTGGAGGIGRAVCSGLAKSGAVVAVADLSQIEADNVATEIGDSAFGVAVDVTNGESISQMINTIIDRAGSIDILVNNAGIFGCEPLLDITEKEFDRIFSVNVRGFLFTLQAVARQMITQKRGGKIVNLASGAGRRGHPLSVVYSASKAATISLTQSASQALIKHGINVNAIAPGSINTAMIREVDAHFAKLEGKSIGETLEGFQQSTPSGRIGEPQDIVGGVLYLVSDDSAYVVGQTLNIDGGMFMN